MGCILKSLMAPRFSSPYFSTRVVLLIVKNVRRQARPGWAVSNYSSNALTGIASRTLLYEPGLTMKKNYIPLVCAVTGATVLLDQLSKLAILQSFQPGEYRPIISGLWNLTLTYNRGAAFGLWSGLPSGLREVVLGLTILLAVAVVTYLLSRSYYQTALAQCSLAAILGGAIGNVIDRVRLGAVVDFLDFYIGSYHWPAFNIADSAICIGVGLLLLIKTPQTTTATDSTS